MGTEIRFFVTVCCDKKVDYSKEEVQEIADNLAHAIEHYSETWRLRPRYTEPCFKCVEIEEQFSGAKSIVNL